MEPFEDRFRGGARQPEGERDVVLRGPYQPELQAVCSVIQQERTRAEGEDPRREPLSASTQERTEIQRQSPRHRLLRIPDPRCRRSAPCHCRKLNPTSKWSRIG